LRLGSQDVHQTQISVRLKSFETAGQISNMQLLSGVVW